MNDRITRKRLEALVLTMNNILGTPQEPYKRLPDGTIQSNEGNLHLDIANGGYAVCRMSRGGGTYTVFNRDTARSIFDQCHAYLQCYRDLERGTYQYLSIVDVREEFTTDLNNEPTPS